MPPIVVPYRREGGKQRLELTDASRAELAEAMLADVLAAAEPLGETIVADDPRGQGPAVVAALAAVDGPALVVNADLPCATTADLERLLAAAPALVAALDGTTNAIALVDAASFRPLYGPGSAARFAEALGARPLDLPKLADDVDTVADLERVMERLGAHTRAVARQLAAA
jgi:2-phospho-L-lactate guanylyltransferase (CobY/MobA/RfbA family)